MNGRKWTKEEMERLKFLLKSELTYKEIGVRLKRTETAIQKKVSKLELTGRNHRSKTQKHKDKISKSKLGSIPWNKGKKGLQEAWNKGKEYKAVKGKNNPKWNGGRRIRTNGYIHILKPEHPHSDKDGYIQEHRLVMERYLGRYLKPKEVVHHINEDKHDNRIENLMLFKSSGEHQKYHWKMRMNRNEHGEFGCINW